MEFKNKPLFPRFILLLALASMPSFGVLAQPEPLSKKSTASASGERPVAVPDAPFELTSSDSIRLKLAYKVVADQIDAKRARESNASALDPFWQASFWRFIPFVPGGPSKIVEDPFVTANYLLLSYGQLDRGVVVSERQSLFDWVRSGTRRNR